MISIFLPCGIPIGELPETGEPSLSLPSLNIFPDLVLRAKFLSSVKTDSTLFLPLSGFSLVPLVRRGNKGIIGFIPDIPDPLPLTVRRGNTRALLGCNGDNAARK